jgi:cytochrome c-type protein NapC
VGQTTPGAAGSWWSRLWAPPKRKWLLGIPLGALFAFILGMLVWAGAGAMLHATSTTHFCAYACHEFEAYVTPSWQVSVHHKNADGVGAGCPDCHLPKPVVPMLVRKARSANEIWGHLTGKIDTQAKFDGHKLEMAERVWAYMKETDSRECRGCHNPDAWDLSAQDPSAQKKHASMKEQGKTCIDCHKGVAHELPPGAEG